MAEKQEQKSIKELINFGIINIDKPTGPTSFSVSHYIMKTLNLNKTSHFGTLDPMPTGVLPVGLGRACRLSDYFMHKNKTYVGIMRLHKDVEESELRKIIKEFIGKILQLPPIRSRVKRAIREREIHTFNILEIDGKDILFETEVQAGTYIRKLCDDMGKKIGGAHMLELRRTKAGIFSEETSVNLYDFDKAVEAYKSGNEELLRKMLVPADEAIKKVLPVVQIKKDNLKQLLTGKPLMKSDIEDKLPEDTEKFAVFCENKIIGIYKKSSENEGDIIARAEFVVN